jgi:hypothetical protein
MNETYNHQPSDRTIFLIGGVACMIFVAYSVATFLILSILGGPPETIEQYFAMIAENKLKGLLRLDLLTVLVIPLYYFIFYGLFVVLKKTNHGLSAISAIMAVIGVTLFVAAPSALSYMHLSDRFAAAVTDTEKNQLIAAGEAVRACDIWHGTGSLVGGLLLQSGALLFSIVMLKSIVFSRLTAIIGIVMYGLDLIHIIFLLFIPVVGNLIMVVAGTLYILWFPLVGIRFFKMAKAQGFVGS